MDGFRNTGSVGDDCFACCVKVACQRYWKNLLHDPSVKKCHLRSRT